MNPVQSCDISRRILMLKHSALAVVLLATLLGLFAQTQPSQKPLSEDDVVKLLTGSVSPKRVGELAHERGIDFQITSEAESKLHNAGADEELIGTLRELAPKPPTLSVTTTPAGARVYIDDEFLDTTSSQGRLKISRITPGQHRLRFALDGYRDHEESVDLAAGKPLEVSVVLEPNTQTTPPAAPSPKLSTLPSQGAHSLAGVTLPDTEQVGATSLVLNGLGLRAKFAVKVYVAGLYIVQKSSDPNAIIKADAPKRIVMQFLHDANKNQIANAFGESFNDNTPDAVKTMKADIDRLLGSFEPVRARDQVVFTYVPGTGTTLAINGKEKLTIAGPAFGEVIFSVWLGRKPPNADLKKGMLGQ